MTKARTQQVAFLKLLNAATIVATSNFKPAPQGVELAMSVTLVSTWHKPYMTFRYI